MVGGGNIPWVGERDILTLRKMIHFQNQIVVIQKKYLQNDVVP